MAKAKRTVASKRGKTSPPMGRTAEVAPKASDRPWRVRDRFTGHRYYFDTRPEADSFVGHVSTSEITGETLKRWVDRLIVERNK